MAASIGGWIKDRSVPSKISYRWRLMDQAVAEVIVSLVSRPDFAAMMAEKTMRKSTYLRCWKKLHIMKSSCASSIR